LTREQDASLQRRLQHLYDEAGFPVDVDVESGVARVSGVVTSPRERQAVLDIARAIDGVRDVDDQIEFEVIAPDMAYEEPDVDGRFGYADQGAMDDDVPDVEPAFDQPGNSWGFQRSIEEAEPYFPPTDPVVLPSDDDQELRVVGGFQDSSMEDTDNEMDEAFGEAIETGTGERVLERDDEDVRLDVLRELSEDALTAELEIEVSVVNGVVYLRGRVQGVEDSENVESVAARVPGVIEVQDLTETDL
jgi:osmotically-inducible protein OsmY